MTLVCKVGLACNLCGECVEVCPGDALHITEDMELDWEHDDCTFCEVCVDVCPEYAIRVYEKD